LVIVPTVLQRTIGVLVLYPTDTRVTTAKADGVATQNGVHGLIGIQVRCGILPHIAHRIVLVMGKEVGLSRGRKANQDRYHQSKAENGIHDPI
jgi:hypothetical protein